MNTSRKMTFRIAVAATGAAVSMAALAPVAMAADAPTPAIKSLSVATGLAAGGQTVTLIGTNLAASCEVSDDCTTGFVTPDVKFGTAAATNVRAFSDTVVQVTVPKSDGTAADGKYKISVDPDGPGDAKATESAKTLYTYTADAPSVTNAEDGVLPGEPTAEVGAKGLKIVGDGLAGAAVSVGGKAVKGATVVGDTLTYDAPAALTGYQPVTVKTKGGTIDAGVLKYTATTPVVGGITNEAGEAVEKISLLRANKLIISGTNIDAVSKDKVVTSVVLRNNAEKDVKKRDLKLAVDKASTADKLIVTTPKGSAKSVAITDGDIILTTKYTESAPNDLTAISGYVAGTPKVTLAEVTTGATSVRVTGENLGDLVSVKWNGTAVDLKKVTNSSASGFDLAVEAVAPKGKATTVPIEVVTDGGKAAKVDLKLVDTPSLLAATANLKDQTITIPSSGPLKAAESSADVIGMFTFSLPGKDKDGKDIAVPLTAKSVKVTETGVTATFDPETLIAGDVVSIAYKATDKAKLQNKAGDKTVADIATLKVTVAEISPTFTTAAVVTDEAGESTVKVTGANLSNSATVVLTSPTNGTKVLLTGEQLFVDDEGTSLTFPAPTAPGKYTVQLKTAAGALVAPTGANTFEVKAPVASFSGFGFDGESLAVSGANLDLVDVVATEDGALVKDLVWNVDEDKSAVRAAFTPAVGKKYAVTVTKKADKTSVTVAEGGSASFTYAAPTYAGATYAAGKVTVTGTNLQFARLTVADAKSKAAYTTWAVDKSGNSAVGTIAPKSLPLAAGTWTVSVFSNSNIKVDDGKVNTFEIKDTTPTFTKVERDATSGLVTLTGTNLPADAVVTLAGPDAVSDTPTVSGGDTSLTFTSAKVKKAGDYTVTLKTKAGTAIGTDLTFKIDALSVAASAVSVDDKTVTLTANRAVAANADLASQFALKDADDKPVAISGVTVTGGKIVISVTDTIIKDQVLTLAYTPDSDATKRAADADGNELGALTNYSLSKAV